jgi:hypothetical protein
MNCPIQRDTDHVISTTQELVRSMRKLRRDLTHCQACESGETCQLRSTFHAMIDVAIDEVNQEWNQPAPETQP